MNKKGILKNINKDNIRDDTKYKNKDKMANLAKLEVVRNQESNDVKLDEILKSLFTVSKKVLIKMMNSIFKENFDEENTEITFENNEFIVQEYDIIRGDLFLRLSKDSKPYHYHIELQTKNDSSMIIRMFEYGFNKAKELAKYENHNGDDIKVYIPK